MCCQLMYKPEHYIQVKSCPTSVNRPRVEDVGGNEGDKNVYHGGVPTRAGIPKANHAVKDPVSVQ